MKLMLNDEIYTKRYRKFLFQFPLLLIIVSVLGAFIYHSQIIYFEKGDISSIINIDLLTSSFFHGSIVAVVIYFIKSRKLEKIFKEKPSDVAENKIDTFLPCLHGVWPYQYQDAFLTTEGTALRLYVKKVGGFVMVCEWNNLSMLKIEAVREPLNPFLPVLFNTAKSIRISDGKKSKKILFAEPEQTAEELSRLVKSI
ncbi:MAG: hypothetical protein JXK07_14635 [Spirochaetes bacterium]|nr:hypothetical protein [Spirochaetota bacterium]MBN2770230.1 hypothetical protein [Spirochaetota bacterium]